MMVTRGGVTTSNTTAIAMTSTFAFALSPALVNSNVIDYSTTAGIKLYQDATRSLSDDKFDQSTSKTKWKKEKPKDISKSKYMNGKTYWWCERHNVWAIHKPEDCKEASNDDKKTAKTKSKPKIIEATEGVADA